MESKDKIKEIASIAWKGAANSFRMYPDNKHTFTEYWDGAESQFKEFESNPNLISRSRVIEELEGMKIQVPHNRGGLKFSLPNETINSAIEKIKNLK